MTLTEKFKGIEHLPGHFELEMIVEDLCTEVDDLKRRINEPMYGPMIEDEED
jgi:hypothetical protein